MAVVQISKIQVRRGQKNTGIGVPQLSSAEFAWAIDSQELFIGNGSVAEGAPYVGNTKILTEHDNILELASSYQFAEPEPSIAFSIPRSLQTKLDEYVSVLDYGANPDGSTDNVEAFEKAFTDLFKNVDSRFKKILYVPNGVYVFASNLRIPSTAIIQGETRDEAILFINASNILFEGTNGEQVAEFTSTNRPRKIHISNLTISRGIGETDITGIADSVFENVKWLGEYELGDTIVGPVTEQPAAVKWENSLPGTKVTEIEFRSCKWESNSVAIRSDQIIVDSSQPPNYDTFVNFEQCDFIVGYSSIIINGILNQGNRWTINDCRFEEIYERAFVADFGYGTKIQRSKFINCGNQTNTAASPVTDIVSFGQPFENIVIQCSSNRHQEGGFTSVNSTGAELEVFGAARVSLVDMNHTNIFLSNSFRPLAVFSAYNRYTYIDYVLNLGVHSRSGQLVIMTPDDQGSISLTDNYAYSTPFITDPGGILMTNFQFTVELRDNNADSGLETILLSYQNPLATGSTGTISYSISYGV